MCFSAGASFTASAVLTVAGIIAVKEARITHKLAFGAIPLLFAVQQFSEGILWTSFQKPEWAFMAPYATMFFLVFAKMVWPVWVPLSVFMMEHKKRNKKFLLAFTGIGIVVAVYELYYMTRYPVSASIDCSHILYFVNTPDNTSTIVTVLYLLVTIIPAFLSSLKWTNLLGIVIVISLIVSQLFYEITLVSVWCFFAAILSVIVIYILYELRKVKV